MAGAPLALHESGLWTLEARLPDRPCRLFFDTGAGLTCLTPELCRSLGLAPLGRATGFRMSGERVDMPLHEGPALTLADTALELETVACLDIAALLPGTFSPVDGVLALDALASRPFTITTEPALQIETADSLAERRRVGALLDVRLARPAAGLALDVFLRVKAPPGPDASALWLELDTGKTGPTLIGAHRRPELGLSDAATAGRETAPAARSLELDLGAEVVRVDAQFRELIYDGVIGAELFADRPITFDLARAEVWLGPRQERP